MVLLGRVSGCVCLLHCVARRAASACPAWMRSSVLYSIIPGRAFQPQIAVRARSVKFIIQLSRAIHTMESDIGNCSHAAVSTAASIWLGESGVEELRFVSETLLLCAG